MRPVNLIFTKLAEVEGMKVGVGNGVVVGLGVVIVVVVAVVSVVVVGVVVLWEVTKLVVVVVRVGKTSRYEVRM